MEEAQDPQEEAVQGTSIRRRPITIKKPKKPPVPHKVRYPDLSIAPILAWADAHYARTGRWPAVLAGPIADAPGETWLRVHDALIYGQRGLPGGSSLARLLQQHRADLYCGSAVHHNQKPRYKP
jgi:hypothetical protein